MKFVVAAVAIALALPPARAADQAPASGLSRAVQQGYDAGWHDCAAALDKFVRFVHENDQSYAMFGHWAAEHPDKRMFTTVTLGDGAVTSFSASRNTDGTCDVAVTEVIVFNDTCKKIADDTFKDWKKSGDLGGATVYEDPTTSSANVFLTPLAAGCLMTKQLLGYGI